MRIFDRMWGDLSRRHLYMMILQQRDIIQEREATIRVLRMAMDRVDLAHAVATRDLVEHFLAALDEDEEAIREGILNGLSDLNDHVARLQEHAEH